MTGRRQALAALGRLVAAMVLVAACSGDDAAVTISPGGATTSTAAPATSGPVTPAPTAGGATSPGGPGTATPGTAGTGSPSTTEAASEEPAVIAVGSRRVGEVAPALLQPGRGDRVVLEVRAQSGAEPDPATLDHLVSVIQAASGKTVAVDGVDGVPGSGRAWSAQEVVGAAAAAVQVESGRSQVVLRLLFLRGTYQGDTGVLGVAVAGDVAAVFADQVRSAAGILVAPSAVEDAVTMHEVGHLLGLVDLILGTGRGDPAHPGHSRNRHSVMYWQVESDLIAQLVDGGLPRDFDDDDRSELAQIRAG